jgi:hypothetical protein
MAIAGKPAARGMRAKGVMSTKGSEASKKTKAAYTKMTKTGRNGFRR